MPSQRIVPYRGIDLDSSLYYMRPQLARFIKNLVYVITDTSQAANNKGGSSGIYKPFEANGKFDISFVLPAGKNQCIGTLVSRDTAQVICLNWNSNNNHSVFIIDSETQTVQNVYQRPYLNLVRSPEFFLHEGGATLETFDFTDPDTDLPRRRSYFIFTTGNDYQKYICLEDSIATSGFDPSLFPHFVSKYDAANFINCGVPTPECPTFTEVPNDAQDLPNFLKFNLWYFRIQWIDVYGRPSEWGKISELYIPGLNDCVSSSDLLPRCLDLKFDAGSPFIDKINVAFSNDGTNWNQDTTLFLYKGSCLGDWWKRQRNTDVNYDSTSNQITYQFCKDKECIPIDVAETNRTENPMPRISQAIAKIGKVIGFGNNKEKFNPIDISDISVTVTPPSTDDSSSAKVEIFCPIINPFTQTYQPVYPDDNGKFIWGGRYSNTNQHVPNIHDNYKQHFGTDTQKGFIGYLAGTGTTPNSAISELYYVDETTNDFIKVDDYSIVFNTPYTRRWYQKFTFPSVAKGKYLFRIASHLAITSDSNFAATSTYVYGQFSWQNKSTVFDNIRNNFGVISRDKELVIDVCNGDYTSVNDTKVLAIFDLTHPGESNSLANVVLDGYVYEKRDPLTSKKEIPVELLNVTANKNNKAMYVTSVTTDHNGFYFSSDGDNQYFVEIFGNYLCNNYKKLISFGSGSFKGVVSQDWVLEGREECPEFADKPCSRVTITGFVKICGSGTPVPNVGVVISRGQYAITGADGSFTIVAHYNNTAPAQARIDNIFYVATKCPFVGCDGSCLITPQIIINPCTTCNDPITITLPEQDVQFQTERGVLSGGRYGFAVQAEDWLGRHTFAQTKDDMFKVMPTIIETKSFGFPTITFNIPSSVTLPTYFKKLNFLITKELSLETYLTWIVDDIIFIDNTGNENDIAPTQIKIYYGSLNEYNSQNNFNTTTNWQFIDTAKQPALNYTTDYVEFYVNGDGTIFDKLTRAIIKYDQTGQYFLIDYDTALKDLKKYAQIRLCRPAMCVDDNLFFELCGSVDVINGKVQAQSVTVNPFDTYNKYRQIPVPISEDAQLTQNIPITLGIPYQHNAPSDLWGQGAVNIGRPNAKNPYECEIIRQNQIALSGPLLANGQLSYLNYFDELQKENFDSWNFEGIVAMIWETAIGLVICQNNNFTVGFNDNIIRANRDGEIILPSAADKFGKPNVKIGNNYGCALFEKNTIRIWQGLVHWLDTKEGVVVQNNFDDSHPVSIGSPRTQVDGGIDSWLRPKIAYVKNWNKTHTNKKYFVGGIDPAGKAYYLSDSIIDNTDYVNNEREIVIEKPETMVFDIYGKFWRGFSSQVPEMFSFLQSDILNQQFFTFLNGIPYRNYTVSGNKKYNTFFGIKCNRVLRVVAVHDAYQKKKWQNVIAISKATWFADVVETDSNQRTRILKSQWKKGLYYSSAAIPCNLLTISDKNTPFRNDNKIFEGDVMFGSYLDIRLIGDPAEDDIYTELFGVAVDLQPDEKIIEQA